MPLSEADTRAKLIDPALHACIWTQDLIHCECDIVNLACREMKNDG